MNSLIVGVKLCGGCREQFDRIKAWGDIRTACPLADFIPVQKAADYDLILILSGCPVQCPDIKKLERTAPMLRVCSPEHIPNVIREIQWLTAAGDFRQPLAADAADSNKE